MALVSLMKWMEGGFYQSGQPLFHRHRCKQRRMSRRRYVDKEERVCSNLQVRVMSWPTDRLLMGAMRRSRTKWGFRGGRTVMSYFAAVRIAGSNIACAADCD